MKNLKKGLFILIMALLSTILVGSFNSVHAAETKYLGLKKIRSSGYGYMALGKYVWKIAEFPSASGGTADLSQTIYCIKGGPGFGSSEMGGASTTSIRRYTQSFNLKDYNSIPSPYKDRLPTGTNYNALMWIIDNLYVLPKSNPTAQDEENKKALLEAAGIQNTLLTDDDIDVVQQLAIWYYTNNSPDDPYHSDTIALNVNAVQNQDADYKPIDDIFSDGWDRQTEAKKLYKYLINTASANASNYVPTGTTTTSPVQLIKTGVTVEEVNGNYIVGPYRINQTMSVNYTLNATYTDIAGNTITPKLAIKEANGDIVSTNETIKELVGRDFYLVMPTSSNITGIKMAISGSYNNTTATYWSVENAPTSDQPVVIVEKKNQPFSDSIETGIDQKVFDLSLRKFITAVNGQELKNSDGTYTRAPVVDVTPLKNGSDTTAIYRHPKVPVSVAVGDEVTYTIRVYNEGEVDGYANQITDHLPAQLEFIQGDPINNAYGWVEDPSDTRTVRTNYLSDANSNNLVKAFDGTTLSYKEVKIKCRVKSDIGTNGKITNIADITNFVDKNGAAVVDRDSQKANVVLPNDNDLPNYKDTEINRGDNYIPGQQDDDDFEKLILQPFDLSLRKFIVSVNGKELKNNDGTYQREPVVDVTPLKNGSSTTAIYNHTKTPVGVMAGDEVTYVIRVYNEGAVDGFASEITDHLPPQLEFIINDATNIEYGWKLDENDLTLRTVKTNYLSKATDENNLLKAFDGTTLAYKEVKIKCRVKTNITLNEKITNIADITDFTNSNGATVTDRDSQKNNVVLPSDNDLPKYKDTEINRGDSYIPGQQDDDDFEKLILQQFDLSLKKYIAAVNGEELKETDGSYTRAPIVDVTPLVDGSSTTAKYTYRVNPEKDPVLVATADIVTYHLRIYNEGNMDGYASRIKDDIPDGLEFLPENTINKEYRWVMLDKEGKETTQLKEAVSIQTDYLSKEQEKTPGENLLKAFDGTNLSYKEVEIAFKVVAPNSSTDIIINKAQIAEDTDRDGNPIDDRDSTPDEWIEGEDDQDIEKVKLQYFDLALRKFIIAVNGNELKKQDGTYQREPVVDTTPLVDGSSTTAIYTHPKDPVEVENGNIVTYTIRVFNEGTQDGYAKEIKDDLPEGLEFLPENDINKEYRWVMLDKDGNETTDLKEAVSIKTDYLSKEQEKTPGENLLKAFDKDTMETLDYKDVKIAFKVTEPNTSDRILINKAQVSDDSDKNGKDVIDRDSTPDKWIEGEDDQDIEKVKVKYFDLALRKWVTTVHIIENGKETVTQTGHTAEMDPEPIVKVDLYRYKLNKVVVKFGYKIRVTNEGEIAGYVKEISDYIPEGLKFVQADNPKWKQVDGKVVTDQLKDTLLKPGESATVDILLTWINGENNLGVKTNVAEISKDYNDSNTPDIDSVPNNKKPGEDDIDDASVVLSIVTGEGTTYIGITAGVLVILATGVYFIKKYVL